MGHPLPQPGQGSAPARLHSSLPHLEGFLPHKLHHEAPDYYGAGTAFLLEVCKSLTCLMGGGGLFSRNISAPPPRAKQEEQHLAATRLRESTKKKKKKLQSLLPTGFSPPSPPDRPKLHGTFPPPAAPPAPGADLRSLMLSPGCRGGSGEHQSPAAPTQDTIHARDIHLCPFQASGANGGGAPERL